MSKGSWHEGKVNTKKKHIYIYYGDDAILICSVQPEKDNNTFVVDFVIEESPQNKAMIDHVKEELDFYLAETQERDRWEYLQYHCGTASNLYSKVHWVKQYHKGKCW